MTAVDERQVTALQPAGVSMLLVYGARLFPPKDGKPGIRVTVDKHGTCLLEAVGWPSLQQGLDAIKAAEQTCLDSDLIVSIPPSWMKVDTGLSRLVRRRLTNRRSR